MNKIDRYLIIAGAVSVAILLSFVGLGYFSSSPASPTAPANLTPTITPVPTPVPTDTELVKSGVANYFMPTNCYGYSQICWGLVTENETLLTLANTNARNGTHSLKIVGDTPDEVLQTFSTYESTSNADWFIFHENVQYQPGLPAYAIGVYKTGAFKTGTQYNISIVFRHSVPATVNTTTSGAYRLVEYPDNTTYLW